MKRCQPVVMPSPEAVGGRMAKVYVVMASGNSPIAINIPWPCAVFDTWKDAKAYMDAKNAKATRNTYYLRSADKEPKA